LDRGALPPVPPQHHPIHYDARAMRNRPRKSSTRVTLVLLGAVALAVCGDSEPDTARALVQWILAGAR
jgi:hypothetical protein